MKSEVRHDLKALLSDCIQEKIRKYNPETESKPFFEAIFSKRVVNLASLMQSFYTSFGTSIYEQMAVLLAKKNAGFYVERQHILLGKIDPATENLINDIHLRILRTGLPGNKLEHTDMIRKSIQPGTREKDPESIVDVFLKTPSGSEYYFDVTSTKPNIKEFRTLKKKLLRWTALRFSTDKSANVSAALAVPYNPYYPAPYLRWTSGNIYRPDELVVGPDFWNFIAAENIYDELIGIFREVGEELHPLIENAVNR